MIEKKTTLEEAAEIYCKQRNYLNEIRDKQEDGTLYHSLEADTAIDAFIAGAKWHKEQMKEIIEKWQDHAIRGMSMGNVSYFQGRVALCDIVLDYMYQTMDAVTNI